jgi:hypothetical protein
MKNLIIAIPILLLSTSFFRPHTAPIAVDGKISFANQPLNGGGSGKTSFTSAEHIYGKMELSAATIKEAFKLKESEGKIPFLKYRVNILRNGEIIHYGNSRDFILLQEEAKNSKTLYFDVLPLAAKASTLFSMTDDFSAGLGMNPLVGLIRSGRLPTGDYKIRITIYNETFNAYGSVHDEDKWPALAGEFDLKFSEDDVESMFANDDKVTETIVAGAFRYDKLPPVFSSPGKLTDPAATQAKIAAILKRDLPKRQILKWVAESYNGTYWHIAKDDFGLPKYKYFNPHIWMAYKIDGKCYVGNVTLRQVYSGGGTYGPLQVAFTSSSSSTPDKGIDCIKVK